MAEQSPSQRSSSSPSRDSKSNFSLDTWAVALSLAISLLVWLGVIKHIPW